MAGGWDFVLGLALNRFWEAVVWVCVMALRHRGVEAAASEGTPGDRPWSPEPTVSVFLCIWELGHVRPRWRWRTRCGRSSGSEPNGISTNCSCSWPNNKPVLSCWLKQSKGSRLLTEAFRAQLDLLLGGNDWLDELLHQPSQVKGLPLNPLLLVCLLLMKALIQFYFVMIHNSVISTHVTGV